MKTTYFCSGPRCGEKFAVCREGASHGRTCFEKHKEASYEDPGFSSRSKGSGKRARSVRSLRASSQLSDDGDGDSEV